MFYRCLNDMWNYCKGEPDTDCKLPKSKEDTMLVGKTCKLDKATCGKHSTTPCNVETK